MSTLHSSLYAAALLSCVLLIFVARDAWREPRRQIRFLVVLLALLSLNFAFEWLMSNPATPMKALWLALVMGVAFLLAPCLWLHARSITEATPPRVRDLPRGHLLPIVAGLVLLLPLLTRTHLGSDFTPVGYVPDATRALIVHGTMLAAILIFVAQAFHYLRASVHILRRQARAAKALRSNLEDRELNALRLMIFVVGAHWVVGIARTLHCLMLGKDAGYVALFAVAEVMITLWAMTALMRGAVAAEPVDRELANEMADAKYARSALDVPARARITRKLGEAWSAHRLHRDSRLTLRRLCDTLRENPHYVSQVINQDLGTNFYDLVNRQRIADATDELLRDPARPVLEIALAAGFNSKSTFNAAFRLHAGTTPSALRASRARPDGLTASDPAG